MRFKDFKIGDDFLEWLNNVLHKLKFYRLQQNDKIKVLRSLLRSPLSEWSHKIDNETPNLDYDSFTTKLIEKINSSALVEKKERALRNLTYSEKEEGIQFVEKLRNLLKAVESNYTEKRLLDAIRNPLSADVDRHITNFRIMTVKHLTDILITTHEAYLERIGKVKEKKNLNFKTDKEDKLAQNENKGPSQYNNDNRFSLRPRNKRNIICNKCHRQGHYASECRTRLKDKETDLKNKDSSVNAVSASETQTVEEKKTNEDDLFKNFFQSQND